MGKIIYAATAIPTDHLSQSFRNNSIRLVEIPDALPVDPEIDSANLHLASSGIAEAAGKLLRSCGAFGTGMMDHDPGP